MPTNVSINSNSEVIDNNAIKLNRLLQLCSANLPVGGFSFSQGLEFAVEKAWVTNVETTKSWIELNLTESIARTDLAVLKRLFDALTLHDLTTFSYWNQHLVACRESQELLLADVAMGKALARLVKQLYAVDSECYQSVFIQKDISFVSAFAICAYLFDIDCLSAQSGYCWTFIDNQVAAATKLVPLGQTQAQNLLFDLCSDINKSIAQANSLEDEEIGASLPHLAMASAWHESQYSRLFRS